jgi:hypothetical protein
MVGEVEACLRAFSFFGFDPVAQRMVHKAAHGIPCLAGRKSPTYSYTSEPSAAEGFELINVY